MQYPSTKHPSRDDFFEKNKTMTFKKAFEETFCSKKNVAILNHCWEIAILALYSQDMR